MGKPGSKVHRNPACLSGNGDKYPLRAVRLLPGALPEALPLALPAANPGLVSTGFPDLPYQFLDAAATKRLQTPQLNSCGRIG
jgi:hypothetical protein